MSDLEISVNDLKTKIDNHEAILILDVREPHEYEICNLGGKLIPLGELVFRLNELDKNQALAVLCRTGRRSQQACMMLRKVGFEAQNITGGILAWATEIDPSLPTY